MNKENKIPTAKEFIKETAYPHELETGISMGNIEEYLIDFAKLHVKAALKEADNKAQIELGHCYECGGATVLKAQNTILDVYPLENIK